MAAGRAALGALLDACDYAQARELLASLTTDLDRLEGLGIRCFAQAAPQVGAHTCVRG